MNIKFTDINDCSPDPCQNGGTCSQDENGVSRCECRQEFTGDYCQDGMITLYLSLDFHFDLGKLQ